MRQTPKSLNYSAGIQREIGWGTVLDVTYAGCQMRHGEMSTTSTSFPTARDSSTFTPRTGTRRIRARRSRTEFLRPYLGYQDITIRRTSATPTTTRCRCSSIAATSTACSSPSPTRWPRRSAWAERAIRRPTSRTGPGTAWNVAPDRVDAAAQPGRQLHLGRPERQPDVEQRVHPRRARRMADIRRHGVRQRRLGRRDARRRPTTSTSPAGTAGTRPRISGDVLCRGDNCDPTPGGTGSYFNLSAFSRLTGRGDYRQCAARASSGCRRSSTRTSPSSRTSRSAAASGSSSGGRCTTCSISVNWSGINTNAQFNPAGEQVNANFGKATSARDPRIMQGGDSVYFLKCRSMMTPRSARIGDGIGRVDRRLHRHYEGWRRWSTTGRGSESAANRADQVAARGARRARDSFVLRIVVSST